MILGDVLPRWQSAAAPVDGKFSAGCEKRQAGNPPYPLLPGSRRTIVDRL
jgi:hypothetical protein